MRLSAYLSVFVALALSAQAASLPAVADVELADRTVRTVGGCVKRIKRNNLQNFCRGYVKKYKKNGCKCYTPQKQLPASIRNYDKAMIAEACAKVVHASLDKCKAPATPAPADPVDPKPADPVVPEPEPTPKDPPFVDTTGCFGGAEMPADPNDLKVCSNCKCEYRMEDTENSNGDVEFTRRAVDPKEATIVRCEYDAASSSFPALFTMPITLDDPRGLGFSLQGASGGGNGRAAGPGGFTQGLSRQGAPQKGDQYDVYIGLPGQTGTGVAVGVATGGRGGGGKAFGGGSGGGGATWVTKHGADSTDADQIIILAPGGGGAARTAITDDDRGWGGRGRGTCRAPRDGETFQREICNRRTDGYGDGSMDPDYVGIAATSRTVGADGQSGGGGGGGGWAYDGAVGGGDAGGSSYSGGGGGGQKRTEEFSGLAPDAAPADGTGRAYVAFGCFGGQQQR